MGYKFISLAHNQKIQKGTSPQIPRRKMDMILKMFDFLSTEPTLLPMSLSVKYRDRTRKRVGVN